MELLTLVFFALLQAKDVRHAELTERFSGSAQTSSVIRWIERFFDRHPLCPADVARVVLALLPDERPREFILDRTFLGRTGGVAWPAASVHDDTPMRTPARIWKYGQVGVNVLPLAVVSRGVTIPLLFELLLHGGSSDTNPSAHPDG